MLRESTDMLALLWADALTSPLLARQQRGVSIGDAIGSGTTGSILFLGVGSVLQQDNTHLFWDDTNNRLGLGLTNPSQGLSLNGKFDIRDTALSAVDPPSYIIESAIDPKNTGQTCLIIKPSVDNAPRLYIGTQTSLGHVDTKTFYAINLYGTQVIENMPPFNVGGLQVGGDDSFCFYRSGADLFFNAAGSSGGNYKWYSTNSFTSIGNGSVLIMTLTQPGDLELAKGKLKQAIGSTTSLMTSVGLIDIQTSSAGIGNAADTTDDTLFTYTLPLNSLSSNGKSLRSIAMGHLATNANTKRVKFWFAGSVIADSGAAATSNTDWLCSIEVTRIDSTHVSCVGKFEGGGLTDSILVTPNLAVSNVAVNDSIVKVTGASTIIGAANDVLGYQMRTEFMN